MVNFGPPNTVPDKFKDRKFYEHHANVTLMRTTVEENRNLGEEIGRKAAAATGPTSIILPLRGVSAIDQAGKAFDDSVATAAFCDGVRSTHSPANWLYSITISMTLRSLRLLQRRYSIRFEHGARLTIHSGEFHDHSEEAALWTGEFQEAQGV